MITAQLADGTKLQFPDNTPQEVIQGVVHKQMGIIPLKEAIAVPVDPRQTTAGRTAIDQGMQGLTLGFGDEISDRGGALLASLMTDEKYKDLLNEARANTKTRLPAQFAERPIESIAANLAGGLITGGAAVSGLKAAAPALGGALESYAAANPYKAALGTGAASGALYGAGAGEGGIKERAGDSLTGSVAGAAGGALGAYVGRNAIAPLVEKLANTGAGRAITKVAGTLKEPNMVSQADKISALQPEATNALAKSEGNIFSKTAGQRTQDPILQRLENDARAGTLTKEAESAIRQADIVQNREFHSYMHDLAKGLDKGNDPNTLIEGVADLIKGNAKSAKTGINNAYDLAREGKSVKINSQDIRQGLWKNITDTRRENVYDLSQMPKATGVIKRLATYSKQGGASPISAVKLGELENWRKQATNALNSSQDPTERRFLGEMVRGYDGFMEKTAENAVDIGDTKAIMAFRDAVKQRRVYGQLFETNKLIGDIVGGQKSVDDTVKNLMGTGSIKGRKDMANNLDAIIKASGKESQNVQDDLRQAFTLNAFKKSIIGYEPNNPSMEKFSPAKLKTELENMFVNQSAFADKLYGKETRLAALRAIKELDLISTSQAGVKNLSGSGEWLGRFLKAPGINRVPGMGLVGKAVEAQKQHVSGAKVTKGLSEFLQEQSIPKSTIWATVAPVGTSAIINRQGE